MKKFTVKASALAIAAALPGMAFAVVDLDNATAVDAAKFASEQTVSGTGSTLTHNAATAADLRATSTFGASFATDAQAYVRVDLSSGVFAGAPAFAVLDSAAAAATTSVSQGGTGAAYVIYAVAPTAGNALVGTNAATITTGNLTVTSQTGITLTYRLFETLTAAANPSSANTLKTASKSFAAFSPALTFSSAGADAPVADVSAATGAYTAFTGADTEAALSMVDVDLNTVALQSGVNAATADVITNTNTAAVTGDFTLAKNDDGTYTGAALARVGLDDDAGCTGDNLHPAATLSATAATFAGLTAAELEADLWLCVAAEGTPAIPTASYSGTVDLVAQTGFTIGDGNMVIDDITRNGTVLKAPLVGGVAGQSTWVQLANMSGNAASYTTRCFAPSGAVSVGTPGAIAAGNTVRLFYNNLGCAAGSNAVEFTLAVPAGSVVGSVIRQSTTTGDTGIDSLTGNQ